MTPIKNIHKKLVVVLFTAGLGLLLMGVHRVFASTVDWRVNSGLGIGVDGGLGIGIGGDVVLSGGFAVDGGLGTGVNGDVALRGGIGVNGGLGFSGGAGVGGEAGVNDGVVDNDGLAGPVLHVHKSPLKRHRSRFGLDGISASFIIIDHPYFGSNALPEVCRRGVYATILAGSSLRGPPCA